MGKKKGASGFTSGPGKLCLNMIVKNEAHLDENKVPIIKRCLDNVGHLLDAVAIVDTGSSDKTIQIINDWCKEHKVPGEVVVDPWRDDFGYSRTFALRHGEKVIDKVKKGELPFSQASSEKESWYLLFMDADNLAFYIDGTKAQIRKDSMGADAYHVEMRGGYIYDYVWCVKVDNNKKWQWYGPRHEYLSPVKVNGQDSWTPLYGRIENNYIDSRREGSRSMDSQKYLRDAISFEKALLDDPLNDRYLYYLAQSYRDAAVMFYQQAMELKKKAQEATVPEEKSKFEQGHQQILQKALMMQHRAEKAFVYRASTPPFNT